MPRIVGLTATLLNKNVSVDKLEEEIRGLEITLNSKIITSSDPNSVSRFSANPDVKFIYYSSQDDGDIKKFMDSADEIINQFDNIRFVTTFQSQPVCIGEKSKIFLENFQSFKFFSFNLNFLDNLEFWSLNDTHSKKLRYIR